MQIIEFCLPDGRKDMVNVANVTYIRFDESMLRVQFVDGNCVGYDYGSTERAIRAYDRLKKCLVNEYGVMDMGEK